MGALVAPRRPLPNIEFPDGALDCYKTALQAGGFVDVVGCPFDSVGMGQPNGSTPAQDSWDGSWFGIIRTNLAARLGLAAEYISMAESASAHAGYNWTSYPGGNPPVLVNGTSFRNSGGYMMVLATDVVGAFPANVAYKITTRPNATRIDYLYGAYFATNLSKVVGYQVDATAATSFTTPAVASAGTQRVTLFNGAAGTHTIIFGGQGTAGDFWPLGFYVEYANPTRGLRIGREGWSGRTCFDHTGSGDQPDNKPGVLYGDYSGTAWGSGFGYPQAPHLGIISIGINDLNRTFVGRYLDPVELYSNLGFIAENARRGRENMSLIAVANFYPLRATDAVHVGPGDSSGWANNSGWRLTREAIRQAAHDYNMVFINFADEVGATGVAKGYVSATDAHLTAGGHAALGAMFGKVLGW